MEAVYVIGIAGGTGSGKTTLCRALLDSVGQDLAVALPHDAYYRDLGHLSLEERVGVNFDHPDALETSLLVAHLAALKRGEPVGVPVYNFVTHTRSNRAEPMGPKPVVVVEGILSLTDESLRDQMDLKVFVDTADDLRLIRRMERDIRERGRTVDSVAKQYLATVRPMHDQFVAPSKAHADLIVPGTGDPSAAVSLLSGHVRWARSQTG